MKDLEREQKARLSRAVRDELDSALLDYTSLLRDALSGEELIVNQDLLQLIQSIRENCSPEEIEGLARAAGATREALTTNASQILLLESFFLKVAALMVGKKHRSS